jgi:RNA polymerase sigma-70 factor (ECF subfamily)
MTQERSIPKREFPVTRWTVIGQAAGAAQEEAFRALAALLERYGPCLKAHLVYMKRMSPDRADDVVQGFITEKILSGDLLGRADRGRGKFRTFLLSSLERYVIDLLRREQAAKRSPGPGGHVPIDEVAGEIEAPAPASAAYDVAWARSVITEVLDRVRAECERKKLDSNWLLFDARVVQPLLHGAETPSYEELSGKLAFASPMQASNALITTKRMFGRNLNEVIREYVESDAEVKNEIAELRAVLCGVMT